MFEVKDIKKSYKADFWAKPIEVLSGVSFSVDKGQVVGFLGANGAGKTTLLKIMMGFSSKDSGEIHFLNGQSFDEVSSLIGYLPERPYFYPHLSGREMVEFMGALCDLSIESINDSINKYAGRLKIEFALDRKIKGYSKGMLQRLGMLCTLLHDPKLIILDEPLSGLDPQGRKDIKDLLVELASEGKTIFFSSHIVSDVEEVCEKVVVLDKGTIVYKGAILDLINANSSQNVIVTLSDISSDLEEMSLSVTTVNNNPVYTINEDCREEFISLALKNNLKVLKLVTSTPTLEEVVYKTEARV